MRAIIPTSIAGGRALPAPGARDNITSRVSVWLLVDGRLAQLGERGVRNAEARSSILLPSTKFPPSHSASRLQAQGAGPADKGAQCSSKQTS